MLKKEAFLLSLGVLTIPLSADASTVQRISATESLTGFAPVINVCPITGYNLSFLDMKGGIVQAKLVDPSRVHVSFDSGKVGAQSPGKVVYLKRINQLKFPGLPASTSKNEPTMLTVLTTSRKLFRFKVAYACPSKFDTGIVEGAVASRRARRFPRPSEVDSRGFSSPSDTTKDKDPVVPKPAAKVSRRSEKTANPKTDKRIKKRKPYRSLLSFDDQLILKGNVNNLYGLPNQAQVDPQPVREALKVDTDSSGDTDNSKFGEVSPAPVETEDEVKVNKPFITPSDQRESKDSLQEHSESKPKTSERPVVPRPSSKSQTISSASQATSQKQSELFPQKVAWHLTRGLHVAKSRGEINYGTRTYRKWQSVIALVRRGSSLDTAIERVGTQPKVGSTLLNYGGLK